MNFGDLLEHLRASHGLPSQVYTEFEINDIPVVKRDYWQEGLNQAYADQADFESMIGDI